MSLGNAWRRFWTQQVNPASIAVFRISLGLAFAVFLIACYPGWNYYYAPTGVLSLHDADLPHYPRDPWSMFAWTDPWLPTRVYWWAGFAASIALALGWHTRFAVIFLYLFQHSLIRQNGVATSAGEATFHMLFFYSCFAPLNCCASLDRWKANRRNPMIASAPSLPRIWPMCLAQINIASVYLFAAWYKLIAGQGFWRTGEAIYWVTMDTTWVEWPMKSMLYGHGGFLLSQIMTYGFLLLEGTFAFLIWFRPTRLIALSLMAGFHLITGLMFPPVLFLSLASLSALTLFLPHEIASRWLHGVIKQPI